MPLVPDKPAASVNTRPPLTTRGLTPMDLNSDSMDQVIMRIFNELNRQLEQLENAEEKTLKDVGAREKHARILASLERTMERLAKVEAGRAAARKSVKEQNDGSALEAIERRVAGAVAAEFARSRAEGTHGG